MKVCPDCGHNYRSWEKHKNGPSRTCALNIANDLCEAAIKKAEARGLESVGPWHNILGRAAVPTVLVQRYPIWSEDGPVFPSDPADLTGTTTYAAKWALCIAELNRVGVKVADRMRWMNAVFVDPEAQRTIDVMWRLAPRFSQTIPGLPEYLRDRYSS